MTSLTDSPLPFLKNGVAQVAIIVEDLDIQGQGTLDVTITSDTESGGESVTLTEEAVSVAPPDETFLRFLTLFIVTLFAGFLPAWMIVRQNIFMCGINSHQAAQETRQEIFKHKTFVH